MPCQNHSVYKKNTLAFALFIYLLAILSLDLSSARINLIRIPGFAIILLILVQVIFPSSRFSKLSNLIAFSIIIMGAVLASISPFS